MKNKNVVSSLPPTLINIKLIPAGYSTKLCFRITRNKNLAAMFTKAQWPLSVSQIETVQRFDGVF
jgi:hypothetical protein